MGDFLSRLAGRALGAGPIVQPVIAPSFASGPGVPAGAMEEGALLEAPGRTAEVEWAEAARPDLALERAPESVPEERVRTASTQQAAAAAISKNDPEDFREAPGPAHSELAMPGVPSENQPVRLSPPVILATPAPRSRVAASEAAPSAGLRPQQVRTPGAPNTLAARRRQKQGEPFAADAIQPVQITIGRVEVRAVMAPAAAPRAAQSSKGMLTLEEYTRQRQRGER